MDIFKTQKKGWGVRIMEDVEHGTFIGRYVGKVRDSMLTEENYLDENLHHCLNLDLLETVDNEMGSWAQISRTQFNKAKALRKK